MKKAKIFKQKLERLSNTLTEFKDYVEYGDDPDFEHKYVTREQLRYLVIKTLTVKDTHAVNSWIDTLEAFDLIEQVTEGKTPTNDTVYQLKT